MEDLGPPLVGALNEAGVAFVKLGQVLASRRDVVPARLADQLATLQTQADAEDWRVMEGVLSEELERPPATVFTRLDPVPLAAASIGQVHAARLASGEEVIVKIQRPAARAQVEVDIDIALRLCLHVERRSDAARRARVHRLMEDLAASLRGELDYRVEGRNGALIRAAAERSGSAIVLPRVHPELSTERVLVMERMDGRPLASAAGMLERLAPSRRREIARELIDGVLRQILIDGIFHADLHAGNIMIADDGALGLIDFGSVAVIDREQRELLASFLLALRAEDAHAAVLAIRHLTIGGARQDDQDLRRDIGALFTIVAIEPDTAALSDGLLRLFHRRGLAVPGNLAAAVRTMATLQEAVAMLDGQSDYAALILDRVGAVATRLIDPALASAVAAAQSLSVAQYLRRLPGNLDVLTETRAAAARTSDARERSRRAWRLRILGALTGCAFGVVLGVVALVLVLHVGGPSVPPGVPLFSLVGAAVGSGALIVCVRSAIALHRLADEAR